MSNVVQELIKKHACRDMSAQVTFNQLRVNYRSRVRMMSWGAHAFTSIPSDHKGSDFGLRFAVQGRNHKGHVYVFLAADDTYTVVLTTMLGKEKSVHTGIYCDELNERINQLVEYDGSQRF